MDKRTDVQKACSYIRIRRFQAKERFKLKRISLSIQDIVVDRFPIKFNTTIHIRKTTQHIHLVHSLIWKSCEFSPTTHQRLKCINQHALLELEKARNLQAKYNIMHRKHKHPIKKIMPNKVQLSTNIENGWSLQEAFLYKSNKLYYWSYFSCSGGVIKYE